MADYIAEEHHSGHLLASDLIFPEKIRQWLRDEVDRYGKAHGLKTCILHQDMFYIAGIGGTECL